MTTDERYMQRCLDLAIKGLGRVAPNPMVGCVIVREGKIIGEGSHQQFGEAHAEVNAIRSVANEDLLKESTLYVNLEPCTHFGKTPPCADLIIREGIPRVVIASVDPYPEVSGKGIKKLQSAGIEVTQGVLKRESDYLNRRFITFYTRHRSYVILKWAQSKDGFMALNEPKQFWFTNAASKELTHKWRSEEEAILVGRNTVEVDDPELTVRLWNGTNPLRVIIDEDLTLNGNKNVFNNEADTLVFNQKTPRVEGRTRFVKIDFGNNVEQQVMSELHKLKILSVIIEGGATTLNHFIEQGLWDEARIFTSNHILKDGKRAPLLAGQVVEEEQMETDTLRIITNTA
jgi:diaminohydroxyphosphoribosylaminopyrimidine deaminase/5-amino-6-(5-phosphoribosylamino)uracil reductase